MRVLTAIRLFSNNLTGEYIVLTFQFVPNVGIRMSSRQIGVIEAVHHLSFFAALSRL